MDRTVILIVIIVVAVVVILIAIAFCYHKLKSKREKRENIKPKGLVERLFFFTCSPRVRDDGAEGSEREALGQAPHSNPEGAFGEKELQPR